MLEDANKRLIEMQENQLEVNKALLSYLSKQEEKEDSASVKAFADMMQRQANEAMGSGNSQSIPVTIGTKITLSPKLDFAISYLKTNPHERSKSGRELETTVLMDGETISYKWWNKAKQE